MMASTLEKNHTNIKGLVIEPTIKPTGIIDPAHTYTDEDWENIKIAAEPSSGLMGVFESHLIPLQMLNPSFFKRLEYRENDLNSVFNRLHARLPLNEQINFSDWEVFLALVTDLKLSSPDKHKQLDLEDQDFTVLLDCLLTDTQLDVPNRRLTTATAALKLSLLFPDKVNEIRSNEILLSAVVDELSDARVNRDPKELIPVYGKIKILFPDFAQKLLTLQIKRGLYENFLRIKETTALMASLGIAAFIRVILAEKVAITDEGIKLDIAPDTLFIATSVPVPQVLKF